MIYLKLPSTRTIVENISLGTAKLDKILAESKSHIATYIDIHYPDCQEIIFLLGGKAVKAGRFLADGSRVILNVKETLARLNNSREGIIGFYELSKLLMIVILGTFMFEPTHAKLKSKQIDFKSLLDLLHRKHFVGYLEFMTKNGLNYLTFFDGETREGYFCNDVKYDEQMSPPEIIAMLVGQSDENGEINVYESVGENDLHQNSEKKEEKPVEKLNGNVQQAPPAGNDKDQFTSEMIDLCVMAIYEETFRIMVNMSARQMSNPEIDTMFMKALKEATLKNAILYRGAGTRDDGSLLPTGLVNFERLLKSKDKLPFVSREQEFVKGLMELAELRIDAMKKNLTTELFVECIDEIEKKIASCIKNYNGSFIIMQFLNSFLDLISQSKQEINE